MPITWTAFSLEWLGTASGKLIASVMEVSRGRWLVTLGDVSSLRACNSLAEAKSVAEAWYLEGVEARSTAFPRSDPAVEPGGT